MLNNPAREAIKSRNQAAAQDGRGAGLTIGMDHCISIEYRKRLA